MSEQVRRFYIMPSSVPVLLSCDHAYTPMTNHLTDVHTVPLVLATDYDALQAEAEALRAENGHWKGMHASSMALHMSAEFERDELRTELDEARGLLERVTTSFTIEAYGSALHDARQFLAAALAPEVQASGPYASVAGALAQRYPKPSLLKDCNVSYSNSSRPLAEQGERQGAVAYAIGEPDGSISHLGAIYYTKAGADRHIDSYKGALVASVIPLYTTPQPSQDVRALVSADDVRDACANAVSVFAEEQNSDQCREVAEYMREVLLAQIARQQTQQKREKA